MFRLLILLSLLIPAFTCSAQDGTESSESQKRVQLWRFQTSLYTGHFDPEPDHVNHQKLINFEAWLKDDWHVGLAFFDNSFGQSSQYLYLGKSWDLDADGRWYARVTGGLLHGYKDEYEDKIPLNGLGVAPAIVPAIGFRYKRVFAEAQLLGLAAAMVTAGFTFGE